MKYKIGDILLKIDTRAYKPVSNVFDTRDHVMIVIGVDLHNGCPIIAHMTFPNNHDKPGLKIETLTRGKDLFLLSYSFNDTVQNKIVELVNLAYQSKKFVITPSLLEKQYQESSVIREKLKLNDNFFISSSMAQFEPNPSQLIVMSCHEFVISVIQSACHQCHAEIPKSLRIVPRIAWSDLILKAAQELDKECVMDCFSFDKPNVRVQYNHLRIFSNAIPEKNPEQNSAWASFCLMQ